MGMLRSRMDGVILRCRSLLLVRVVGFFWVQLCLGLGCIRDLFYAL